MRSMGHERSAKVEVEAKLTVGEGFKMVDLTEVVAGAVATAQPARELGAVYFDTADLELTRWGITLRHRTGEPGHPWMLKLPRGADQAVLARDELRFAGTVERIPEPAIDLVRAFTRGRPLIEVARLHTTRLPTLIADAHNRALVEVADDTVSFTTGDADGPGRFREVEIEAASDNRSSWAALDATVARLIDAGARSGRPLPKVVRALGQPATEPPSVVASPVSARSSTIDVVRRLAARSTIQILVNDPGVRLGEDPEAVHRYRVATRRLRSDLRTFRSALDSAPTDEMRAELRWLGGVVGPIRDLDVLGARIAAHARSLPDQDQPGATMVLARLADERRRARVHLTEALRTERYDALLEALVGWASHPPLSPGAKPRERPAAERAGRRVGRRWKQLEAAVGAGGKDPSDDEFHLIRIAAKRCRYAAEAVAPVAGKPARRFAKRVAKVQGVLGDHHDTVVAEAWLRDAAIEVPEARVAIGGLIAIEREERARLRAGWDAAWHRASRKKARAWFSRHRR